MKKVLLLLSLIIVSYLNAYEYYDFSSNYQQLLENRENEYKKLDKKLNKKYKEIKTKLEKKSLASIFKQAQIKWIKYKENACSAKEYFADGVASQDVMTRYLIAECKVWVTEARLLEFDYIANKNVELAYIIYKNKRKNNKQISYPNEWSKYVDKNCKLTKGLYKETHKECLDRLNYYFKELVL